MKYVSFALLAAVTAIFAAEPAKMEPAQPEALPKSPIVSLEVQPNKIDLRSRYESAQIILTAKLASGATADVTRLATWRTSDVTAVVTPSGQVVPKQDGGARSRVRITSSVWMFAPIM